MGPPVGLDYVAVEIVARAMGFSLDDGILERIRVIESEVLDGMRKKV
jgi:hypothetical protein